MTTSSVPNLPYVGDGSGLEPDRRLYPEELRLAFRNHALPLEGLRYDRTPTGMHYTLTHYDVPFADPATWTLVVGGHVRQALTLSLDNLQHRPVRTVRVTIECAGDGRALLQPRPVAQPWLEGAVGTADWTGTPLRGVLDEAGLDPASVDVLFTGADRGVEGNIEQDYQRSLPLREALNENVLLAWAMNDQPLDPQHGFPLRLVVPGWYGMTHVKWLRSIEVLNHAFDGYQQTRAYRYNQVRDELGEPVTLMRVRSLMIPPGIPDFLTRTRLVRRGKVELQGRAWSGQSRITLVEVSLDGGTSWAMAEVEEPTSAFAWQAWRYEWQVGSAGAYELCCRATDLSGAQQPVQQYWTARGVGNNTVHRVQVLVQ